MPLLYWLGLFCVIKWFRSENVTHWTVIVCQNITFCQKSGYNVVFCFHCHVGNYLAGNVLTSQTHHLCKTEWGYVTILGSSYSLFDPYSPHPLLSAPHPSLRHNSLARSSFASWLQALSFSSLYKMKKPEITRKGGLSFLSKKSKNYRVLEFSFVSLLLGRYKKRCARYHPSRWQRAKPFNKQSNSSHVMKSVCSRTPFRTLWKRISRSGQMQIVSTQETT